MSEKIFPGSMRNLYGTFYSDAAGTVLVDPDVVKVFIRKGPNAATRVVLEYGVDEAVTRESLGKYRAQVEIDVSGYWYYGWGSDGNVEEYFEEAFYVEVPKAK